MKAYKIWHDERHYIHKDTEHEMNLKWTPYEEDAKEFKNKKEAENFCYDKLGMNPYKQFDRLYFT